MRVSELARFGTLSALGASALLMVSCGLVNPNAGGESTVRIRFPEAPSSSESRKLASVSAQDFSFAKSCFIVNVTGSGIEPGTNPDPSTLGVSCDIKRGVFKGTIAPGSEIALTVPNGTARRLEVFAYQRNNATDACPPLDKDFGKLSKEKIVRVGLVESFDTVTREVKVPVTLVKPATETTNIITQYGLSLACVSPNVDPAAGRGSAGLSSGAGVLKSTHYKMKFTASGLATKAVGQSSLSSSHYKVQLDRGSQ